MIDRYISGLMPISDDDNIDLEENVSLFDNVITETDAEKVEKFPPIAWDAEFARISIEAVGLSDISVYNGDAEKQLSKGAGHYTGSRFPGQGGNTVILAHRNKEFKALKKIEVGDLVNLDTFYSDYVYRVVETDILDGDDNSLILPDDSAEKLTLYTCYPFNYVGHAPKRFYVICELVSGDLWDKETGTFIPYEEGGVSSEE